MEKIGTAWVGTLLRVENSVILRCVLAVQNRSWAVMGFIPLPELLREKHPLWKI